MCRTVTNFLLTQRAMLRGPSRYLEHVRKVHRKFCRGLWKESFISKNEILHNILSSLILSFIFENPKFFHFCWHIIWLVCSAVTIFILTQRTRLGAPSRYLENIRKLSTENFLETFENEFSTHKICFCQAQNEARIF